MKKRKLLQFCNNCHCYRLKEKEKTEINRRMHSQRVFFFSALMRRARTKKMESPFPALYIMYFVGSSGWKDISRESESLSSSGICGACWFDCKAGINSRRTISSSSSLSLLTPPAYWKCLPRKGLSLDSLGGRVVVDSVFWWP